MNFKIVFDSDSEKKIFFDLDLPGVLGPYLPQGQLFSKNQHEIRNQRQKLNKKTY